MMAETWPSGFELELYLTYPDIHDSFTLPSDTWSIARKPTTPQNEARTMRTERRTLGRSPGLSSSTATQPLTTRHSPASSTSPSSSPLQHERHRLDLDLWLSHIEMRDETMHQIMAATELQEPPEAFGSAQSYEAESDHASDQASHALGFRHVDTKARL